MMLAWQIAFSNRGMRVPNFAMTSTGHAWPNQTVIAHTSVEAQPLIGRHNLPVFVGAIPEWRAQPSIPIKLCYKRDQSSFDDWAQFTRQRDAAQVAPINFFIVNL
jgi:hypothetical protein